MIAWGVGFLFSYTRAIAKEQKEFGERRRISRGISENFHFYSARIAAVAAITLGLAVLAWELIWSR